MGARNNRCALAHMQEQSTKCNRQQRTSAAARCGTVPSARLSARTLKSPAGAPLILTPHLDRCRAVAKQAGLAAFHSRATLSQVEAPPHSPLPPRPPFLNSSLLFSRSSNSRSSASRRRCSLPATGTTTRSAGARALSNPALVQRVLAALQGNDPLAHEQRQQQRTERRSPPTSWPRRASRQSWWHPHQWCRRDPPPCSQPQFVCSLRSPRGKQSPAMAGAACPCPWPALRHTHTLPHPAAHPPAATRATAAAAQVEHRVGKLVSQPHRHPQRAQLEQVEDQQPAGRGRKQPCQAAAQRGSASGQWSSGSSAATRHAPHRCVAKQPKGS